MDQLKKILTVMKIYHYWIITGLVFVLATTGYVIARLYLSDEISKRITVVEGKYKDMEKVKASAPTHPNSNSEEEMVKLTKILSADVKEAWSAQYARQEKLFKWPENAFPSSNYQSTVAKLQKLRPYELNIEYPVKENGPNTLTLKDRNTYRDYIKLVFPDLAKRIGAKWTAESASNDSQVNQNDAPIVEWPSASQQELVSSICYWDKGGEAPSTLQVCYAQEDLWILEGILRIIETTNSGARANFQAAIKEIEFIRFGSRALEQAGDISSLSGQKGGFGAKTGGLGGSSGGPPNLGDERGGMGMGNLGGGGGKLGDKPAEFDPAGNRYVDDKFAPMDGTKVRSAMNNLTMADAPTFVAKRVPVRLRFKRMDQRRLNEFLAACGSAELVLEVRQVRLNTTAATAPSGGGGGGGGGGSGSKLGGLALGAQGGMGNNNATTTPAGANDLPIEIYGIIYLYNPVNEAKLALISGEAAPPAPALPGAGVAGAVGGVNGGAPPTAPANGGLRSAGPAAQPNAPAAGPPPADQADDR